MEKDGVRMNTVILTLTGTIGVALISLIGTIFTTKASSDKIQHELDKHNAVQDTKLEELTREVRQHNDFAIKIPVIEQRVIALEKETFKNKG